MLPSCWTRNDGLRLHYETEPVRFPICQQIVVVGRFVTRHSRLIEDVQALQPFDVDVSFPSRHDQANRVALLGPHRFAVLTVGNEHIVHDLLQRDAACVPAGIASFCKHPLGARLHTRLSQECGKWHARPLAAAEKPRSLLRGWGGIPLVFAGAASGAFKEMDARNRWKPFYFL